MRIILCYLTAMLVLAVAVGAKIPSSHCHCHERSSASKNECPFGKLRLIAGTTLAASTYVVADAEVVAADEAPLRPTVLLLTTRTNYASRSRAPPVC